jgi:hypothetical protein
MKSSVSLRRLKIGFMQVISEQGLKVNLACAFHKDFSWWALYPLFIEVICNQAPVLGIGMNIVMLRILDKEMFAISPHIFYEVY